MVLNFTGLWLKKNKKLGIVLEITPVIWNTVPCSIVKG